MASTEQARAALAPHGALAPQLAAEHWRGEIALPGVREIAAGDVAALRTALRAACES